MILSDLLKNDYFQLTGWIMTVISGCISIYQTIQKKKLKEEVKMLKQKISLSTSTTRDRKITQGESSQYIETANGTINIGTKNK